MLVTLTSKSAWHVCGNRKSCRKQKVRRGTTFAYSFDPTVDESTSRIQVALAKRYGDKSVRRVLDSLNFASTGQEYTRFHPGKGLQKATSYIEGLTAEPFHDVGSTHYAWMRQLEREHLIIRDELTRALSNPQLSSIGNRIWAAAAREEAIAYGPDWKTLVLQDRCVWDETNCALFPKTVGLLKGCKVPTVEAFFARQAPGTGIKPHSDDTNFILTSHLGLDVPEGECWMKVGDYKQEWMNGRGMIADTSFIHSTSNDSSSKTRYVLILRFWHPELTLVERHALQFLFDALNDSSADGLANAGRMADMRESKVSSSPRKGKKGLSSRPALGLLSKGMK